MPSTRPEQVFDEEGVCDACRSADKKHHFLDWSKRAEEFEEILVKYRGDGSYYDCIIPVSGGKDSCYQAITMRDKYRMTPLCVNHFPCAMTEVGYQNLEFLRDQGFDLIQVAGNRKSYREMVRIGFFELGDSCWPEHIGIFTVPVRIAVNYKIPLIIWGENSQFEYGGPASKRENNYLDRNWLEQFLMCGYRVSDVVNHGIDNNDVKVYHYPADEEINQIGVTGLFLGYYEKWDSKRNADMMIARGWHRNPGGPVEGAYNDIENLDCKWIGGLHDYMKFLKYGYGRATDQLCIEIRSERMTREQAVIELSKTDEGKIPWKYVPDLLEYLSITKEQFLKTLDRFTNKTLFERNENGSLKKDEKGDVIRRFFPE